MPLVLQSPAFENGTEIPEIHTCDGRDISPPLHWSGLPRGTASLVLLCEDPDAPAGTWDHWILFNLPPDVTDLPPGASTAPPEGSLHGRNSWTRNDYGGPCPPSGTHRYIFRLYALDEGLDLNGGASKGEIIEAMDGHILERAELVGVYSRRDRRHS